MRVEEEKRGIGLQESGLWESLYEGGYRETSTPPRWVFIEAEKRSRRAAWLPRACQPASCPLELPTPVLKALKAHWPDPLRSVHLTWTPKTAADPGNSPLSITEIPQLIAGVGCR